MTRDSMPDTLGERDSSQPGPSTQARGVVRTRLRALQPDDWEPVQALLQRHAWPRRSRAGWDWALFDSPARVARGADAGWVLEHGHQVVGFLGNLPMHYRCDGLDIWGATCTSYLVDEAHRAHSTRLIRSFAAQPGAAFVFSATANPHSAPVYRGFKFNASPQPRAQQRLRWWASEAAVAEHALQRAHLGLLKPLGRVAAVAPRLWRQLHEGLRGAPPLDGLYLSPVHAQQLSGMQSSHWPRTWDAWAKVYCGRPGLWVDRSAAMMAWRLADPDLAGDLAAWALRDGDGRMLGMCSARWLPAHAGLAPRVELLDWALLPQTPAGAPAALMRALLSWARQRGAATIDAKRWTGEPAAQLESLQPRRSTLPPDAVWLLTHTRRGVGELGPWPTWSMTGADSDDWFCSHRLQPRLDAAPWRPPGQACSADVSSATRSAKDSTSTGSKSSMSTV
jgi:hypothetical protein